VILLGCVVGVHAAFWAFALATAGALVPVRQIVAETLSTLAIVLLACNLILATRVRFLERYLRGLDKLFVTHRLVGLIIAGLVIVHATIVPKSVGYFPSKPPGYATIALLLTSIFVASAPRFPWRDLVPLKYGTWKSTHRLMGLFLAAAALHSLLAPTYVRRVPVLAAYVYTVAAIGFAAWVYRETLFARFGPFRDFTIDSARDVGSNILEVSMSANEPPIARRAGQFLFASFAEGPSPEQHPFTVSSGPTGAVRFSIKASGDFTEELVADPPSTSIVRVEGPYGAFNFSAGRCRQLWLAGGIGITPFLSMAADLDDDKEVTLIWSVRTRADAVYEDELRALSERTPGLSVIIHPTSELGHVDISGLGVEDAAHDLSAFICGPLPMRRSFMRQLKALGVPRSEIFFEEFRLR